LYLAKIAVVEDDDDKERVEGANPREAGIPRRITAIDRFIL